jgi:hypothetical protein
MTEITINGISIDPEEQSEEPRLAHLMSADSSKSDYIIIQTEGPITKDQRNRLIEMQVEILEYVPENGYICRYEPDDLDAIRNLTFVAWANTYMDGFKLPANLRISAEGDANVANLLSLSEEVEESISQQLKQVVVVLHKGTSPEDVREPIALAARMDPDDLEFSGKSVRLTVPSQDLNRLGRIDSVRHIEEYVPPKLHNNVALDIINASDTHDILEGEGQIIAICDTGFDKGSLSNVHPAFNNRLIKLYSLGRNNESNDPHGHGTHVAGSAVGDGQSNTMGGPIRGTAPKAKLVFQSVLDAWENLGGIPGDLTELFKTPYRNDGARVHTNSWGQGKILKTPELLGLYNDYCQQLDSTVWENRDYVICFSAGNEGIDRDRNGVVDHGSISPPGTAKNCITVGASESNRPLQSKTYKNGGINYWDVKFQTNPLASDLWADNIEGMAAFSSRGPTKNGRIKPDLVAPGTSILSAHSRDADVSPAWGNSSDTLFAFMGGTSMATPLVAGCAAVVREYCNKYHEIQNPSASLVKAMLINGATDMLGQYAPSEAATVPNFSEGFGRVNLAATVGPFKENERIIVKDEATELDVGEEEITTNEIMNPGGLLKATLVWTDPPGEALQNDLDLIVRATNGIERHGNMPPSSTDFDRHNNVEQIFWSDIPVGEIEVIVRAHRIPIHPQSYSLVIRTRGSEEVQETIDAQVEIEKVNLYVVDPPPDNPARRLQAQIHFHVSGSEAKNLTTDRAPYKATIRLVTRDSSGAAQLAVEEESSLKPKNYSYKRTLHFDIPTEGRYTLRTRISIETPYGEITAEYEGPNLRVV